MDRRTLGRTELNVSVLSFGCGAVGGLMVRGTPADQERAIAKAMEYGINYFDTAPMYGNGESERNLGRVLKNLGRPMVVVGTKVFIGDRNHIVANVARSMDESLQRLGMDSVDLLQLHNPIAEHGRDGALSPSAVIQEVIPAFEKLRAQGKARHIGFTALGDTPAILQLIPAFDTAQICYNVLNPSAGMTLPTDYPSQDYGNSLAKAQHNSTGTIGIRVLAGGALSGVETRHPLGMPNVEPLGSATTYAADVARACRLEALVKNGHVGSLIEAAIRYVISNPRLCTTLVGLSTIEHLQFAAEAALKGPLSSATLERVEELQCGFIGETR